MLQHLSSVYDPPEETIYERPSTCGQLVASRGDSGGGDWTMPVLEQNRSVPNPETDPSPIHFIVQISKAFVLKNTAGVEKLL
jgi:hypothetical protein